MAEQRSKGTVLVTDAERGSALCIIRSLGRAGWRVVSAGSRERCAGFRSRYASARLVYPDPRRAPEEFVETLLGAVRDHRIDLVLPVTDDVIHALSAARDRFEGLTRLALPDPQAFEVASDKGRTVELARRLGIPTPRTRRVRTEQEADEAARELGWPLVIKPESSRHWDGGDARIEVCSVTYASSRDDLLAQVRAVGGRYGLLLQEYCAGEGVGVELLALEGRPVAAFQHRRLAEVPVTGGASAWREGVALDPELYAHALRFVSALSWTGPIMIEFKVGAAPYLMEVNGRVWGSMPLAVESGVDFPARWAELCMRDGPPDAPLDAPLDAPPAAPTAPPADCGHYQPGVRVYNLELLLSWMVNVVLGRGRHAALPAPARRQVFDALLGILGSRDRSEFAASDDPRPARAQLPSIARKLAGKLGWMGGTP